jgi:putative transposase
MVILPFSKPPALPVRLEKAMPFQRHFLLRKPLRETTGGNAMRGWQSLLHVKWECKYHVVIVPKYRKRVLYGRIKRDFGKIIRQLCRQKEVELLEGHAMPDHIHLMVKFFRFAIWWIILGGIPRVIFYTSFELANAADKRQIPALMVKHTLMFVLLVWGAIAWKRLKRKVEALRATV